MPMSNVRSGASTGASVRGPVHLCLLPGLILGLTLVALPRVGAGQTAPSSTEAGPTGYGFAQGGVLGLDLDGLNARLSAAGLPGLDGTVPTWGGAGYGVVGRFHFGGVGHGGLDPAETTGSTRVGLTGGYGLARVKYEALSRGGFTLLPALGLGAGGVSLRITDLDAPTFDDVLDDPTRSSTLSTGLMFLLDVGVALDYRLALGESDGGAAWGLAVGVEGGYLLSPGETSWTLDDINGVAGGPDLGIEGFYLWISIGGWGRGAADR